MKRIYIIPRAGLCNRMRSMASGIWVAKQCSVDAVVYWNRTHECYCDFTDIFKPTQVAGVQVVNRGGWVNKIPSKRNLKIPKYLQRLRYDQVIESWNKGYGDILKQLKDVDEILLISQHSMAPHYPLTELFKLKESVQALVDEATAGCDSKTVGLHFRGTDHEKCKQVTTLEKFTARIDKEIDARPATTFFLATDEISVRKALIERYGKRIMYRENVLNRNSVAGMIDGAVDLYCLSKTTRIIGSYWSSYSEIAAELGGIDLEVCK